MNQPSSVLSGEAYEAINAKLMKRLTTGVILANHRGGGKEREESEWEGKDLYRTFRSLGSDQDLK